MGRIWDMSYSASRRTLTDRLITVDGLGTFGGPLPSRVVDGMLFEERWNHPEHKQVAVHCTVIHFKECILGQSPNAHVRSACTNNRSTSLLTCGPTSSRYPRAHEESPI